jgi:anti-sigma regulatory factor (Ser/Thr protein kinase)
MVNRLCLRAHAGVGAQLAAFVAGLAAQAELAPVRAYRLRLAADEIVTNIAVHGYHGRPEPVELSGAVETDRVWLRIEDEGPPFDPRTHDPRPRLEAGSVHTAEGGFGLFLALSGVDDFDYDRLGGKNRNTLIMHRR